MHNHSYENELKLHMNEISFSYEKMGTKTHFEEEAKGNSEMADCFIISLNYYARKIGQFSGPYNLLFVSLKFKAFFVAKMFRDLAPILSSELSATYSLALSFTLNSVLKRANGLTSISN